MTKSGLIKIIGGKFKNRKITFLAEKGLRPTPNRIRETLFNWLAFYINDAVCLDLFAGSGALGLEALSRGASWVTFVDSSEKILKNIKKISNILQIKNAEYIRGSVPKDLEKLSLKSKKNPIKYNIIFLDPPFHKDLLSPTCKSLEKNELLANKAFIYLEAEFNLDIEKLCPSNWKLLHCKIAGQVKYALFQRSE